MTKNLIFIVLVFFTGTVLAQSSPCEILKNKFHGDNDVVSIKTSGFVARTILWMADDPELKSAIKDVRKLSLVTVPKGAFAARQVTVNGFRKYITDHAYELVLKVRDQHDDIDVFVSASGKKKSNRYFIMFEDDNEVVGIEITGHLDPEMFLKTRSNSLKRS